MKNEQTTKTETIKHKVLGFTESVTACDCCGKVDLKGTYAIQTAEGDIKYYGSVCAFKVYNITSKQLKEAVKQAEAEAIAKAKVEFRASEEYKEYTQYMTDREAGLAVAEQMNNEEMREAIIHKSISLGAAMREVKEAIAKKHGIKYSYKIG